MTKTTRQPDCSQFSFSPAIQSAIAKAGYRTLTDVQRDAIPPILQGQDVLARAETGSGKTAAFVLPLLENLSNKDPYRRQDQFHRFDASRRAGHNQLQVVVLTPTRELAIQVAEVFQQLSQSIEPRLSCLSVYGGVKINPQMMALRGGADVLVATPGRFLDLAEQKAIKFNQVKTLVIDEVDRMMKGDFKEEIDQIIKLLPNKRQNVMVTATFPDSIRTLVREVMKQPVIVNVDEFDETVTIDHRVLSVNHNRKNDLLAHLLNEHEWRQVLIFCSAKRTCDNLTVKLEKRGIKATAMHGNKQQSARVKALQDFKTGDVRILIATDVAARGLDIEQLPCVINYDLPRSPNDYKHRTGRTGRAGEPGLAISLIAHHEFAHFAVIEKHNGIRLEREQIEGFEADASAPPMPERSRPKKKTKNKIKKKLRPQKTENQSSTANAGPVAESNDEPESSGVNAHIWGK